MTDSGSLRITRKTKQQDFINVLAEGLNAKPTIKHNHQASEFLYQILTFIRRGWFEFLRLGRWLTNVRLVPWCWKCLVASTMSGSSWKMVQFSIGVDGSNSLNFEERLASVLLVHQRPRCLGERFCRWLGQIWARRRISESVERNRCLISRKVDGWLQRRRVFPQSGQKIYEYRFIYKVRRGLKNALCVSNLYCFCSLTLKLLLLCSLFIYPSV